MTLLETLYAVTLLTTVTAATLPPLLGAIEEFRVAGAARYMAARVADVRMQAVARSAHVGMRFALTQRGYTFTVYRDGNGNGLLTRDIARGLDPEVEPAARLGDLFRDVDFGALPGTPAVDPGSSPPDGDPIRLGAADILSFTPHGTSTSGSLYLRGKAGAQYAIRVLGQTGRVRVFKFSPRIGRWAPL